MNCKIDAIKKQYITAEDLMQIGVFTEKTRYHPFFFGLSKEDVAGNAAALLELSYRLTRNGTTIQEMSIQEQQMRVQQQYMMLYYLGMQAGLSSVQAYNAAGSAIRMNGAWNAEKGFETPEGEFTHFNLKQPLIGNKLEYAFGNATGSIHNVYRSMQNENNLNSIGIFDNDEGRNLVTKYLKDAYAQQGYGVIQENGNIKVNTLVCGPNGLLNMETIWNDNKLITINTYKTYWNSFVK